MGTDQDMVWADTAEDQVLPPILHQLQEHQALLQEPEDDK